MKKKIFKLKRTMLSAVVVLLMLVLTVNAVAQKNTISTDTKNDVLFKPATSDKGYISPVIIIDDPRKAVINESGSAQTTTKVNVQADTRPVDPKTEGLPKIPDPEIVDQDLNLERTGDLRYELATKLKSIQISGTACGTYSSGEFVLGTSELFASNGCITKVNSRTSTVYFRARDRVIISPGFVAGSGSKFVAYTEVPTTNTSKVATQDAEKTIRDPEKLINGVSVIPNPFHSSFEITIGSKQNQKALILIYNSLGVKVIGKQSVSLSKGLNKITFDCSNLAVGIYMAEVNLGNEKIIKKIVRR